ncbi:MAG: inositol monophosphatase family protein, partial [bacterium]
GMDISKDPKLEKTTILIAESRHIRQEGCSAASLCHVAEGVLDAHIDLRGIVRATDISAGLLMIREAGGVYSLNGELFGDLPLTRDTHCTVIAANTKRFHDEIVELIQ